MSSSAPASNTAPGHDPALTWRWLESQLKGRPLPPVLTIIGLGDAALLDALDAFAPATKVLAIEPGPPPGRTAVQTARLQAWLDAGRLVYLTGPAYAGSDQAWRIFPARVEAPPLIVHPSVSASADLKTAVALLKKIVFGVLANAEARRRLAPGYLLNSLRNLPAIFAGRDVRDLAGCAQGVPAIVVGAGPSLDRSIDELQRLGHRAFIVATDTSLRPLLRHGIVPHVVIALDPSEINGRHLRGLPPCRETWLVAESALDPRACAEFAGRTFWFRVAPHQPWPWLNRLGLDVGRIEVWGSVLTGAFEIASMAGCDPIVMVGADLSYPEGRPYARGTTYEYYWGWQAATGTSVEETWRADMAQRSAVRTEPDLTGADTRTTGVMLEFRDWLLARARKSGRRVINATGRGLLFGDGVEQLGLSEALAGGAPLPLSPGAWPASRPPASPGALAQPLREVTAHLADGRLDVSPLAEWVDFTAGAFDAAAVGAAVNGALRDIESAPARPASHAAPAPRFEMPKLTRLPEAMSRLAVALRGEPLPGSDGFAVPPARRAALLVEALARLSGVTAALWKQADLVSGPDPARIAQVPAGAIGMWPETIRWDVLEFEGLLGEAWGRASPAPIAFGFAAGPVSVRQLNLGQPIKSRPHSVYSCLLLVLEWARCAASLGHSGAAWRSITQRLVALERFLQPGKAPRALVGPLAELVIEASAGERATQFVLPLEVGEAFLARVLTGTLSTGAGGRWEVGCASGDLSVRIAVRSTQDAAVRAGGGSLAAPLPRVVALQGCDRLKVVDQLEAGALCVVPASNKTVVLTEAGRLQPYQTWPKPITGALSLGEHGDVAWSHAWSAAADGARPYLMHRKTPTANVAIMPLPFRPSHGLWWRDRLYLSTLPTSDAQGGVGVWAPGGQVTFAFPNMTVQGLVDAGDVLHLEPYVAGPGEGWGRQRAQWGWNWTPGNPPAKRQLDALGASSSVASRHGWSAVAYPQSDLIVFRGPRGREHWMRCYSPLRLAWAGRSLAVSAAEGVVLLFEHVLDLLEAVDPERGAAR